MLTYICVILIEYLHAFRAGPLTLLHKAKRVFQVFFRCKMADGLLSVCGSADFNYNLTSVNQPPQCSSCIKYKSEWEEIVEELETAKKIIQLLQEDLNTFKDLTPSNILDVSSATRLNSKTTVNWEIVTGTSRKSTRVGGEHRHIPVIPISNRYGFT